jgi:hypothetical protein
LITKNLKLVISILFHSQSTVTIDPDTGERAALSLTVGNPDNGVVSASPVPFTIAGLSRCNNAGVFTGRSSASLSDAAHYDDRADSRRQLP